jgi:flagellar basal-body rod modification protein FlgD
MNIAGIPSQTYPRAADTSNSNASSSSSNSSAPNNTLNGNSFITLLTAQLQAQDPTNPMDPNQMVDELVSINSLQQLIQIQQDLSGGASAAAASSGSGASGASGAMQPQYSTTTPSPSYHDAVMQSKFFPAAPASN